jgi:hypothetical protein
MSLLKQGQKRRQERRRGAVGPADDQRLDFRRENSRAERFGSFLDLTHYRRDLVQKKPSRIRQIDAAPAPFKKLDAEVLLQELQLLGRSGLADAKLFRRPRDVAVLCHRREDHELFEDYHGTLLLSMTTVPVAAEMITPRGSTAVFKKKQAQYKQK